MPAWYLCNMPSFYSESCESRMRITQSIKDSHRDKVMNRPHILLQASSEGIHVVSLIYVDNIRE